MKRILALMLALALVLGLFGCTTAPVETEGLVQTHPVMTEPAETLPITAKPAETLPIETEPIETEPEPLVDIDGWYYRAEDVALYLVAYGCLPGNFITKAEARALGWEGGSVEVYAPGFAIGGDRFYNRMGQLPQAPGRQYYECDIDTDGARSRGAKRLVFSNDGLIYYTEDHYESFILLYGEE